jgi:hypothetical protein
MDVDAKQLGKLIARRHSWNCASGYGWLHLIAGGGEYLHRGQRLPDWND